MLENPCYKCPDRKLKCAVTCEKWKEYTEKRQKIYDARLEEFNRVNDYTATFLKRVDKVKKSKNARK